MTGEKKEAEADSSNMIYYRLENGGWFLIHPSGTELMIKFYVGSKGDGYEESTLNAVRLMDALISLF